MSSFVHGTDHIDLLVSAIHQFQVRAHREDAERGGYVALPSDDLDALGALLLAENVASVQHRYAASITTEEAAGYAAAVAGYRHRNVATHALPGDAGLVVVAAAHSLEYQSCEHPGWADSDARVWMQALIKTAIQRSPGYRAAADVGWSYSRALRAA